MQLTKQLLKRLVAEEVSTLKEVEMYQHVPDEPIAGDLLGALEEVIETWQPITSEGEQYEEDILRLLRQFARSKGEIK